MRSDLALVLTVAAMVTGAQTLRSGLDPSSFDSRVGRQDDLYRFANTGGSTPR